MMKNRIPYVKIKITEIPHEKKPTVNPHVPLLVADCNVLLLHSKDVSSYIDPQK